MARTLFLKLFVLIVILLILDNATARRKRKKERRGHCKMSRRSKNERMVDLQIGEKKRWLKMKKRHLRVVSKRPSHKRQDLAFFSTADESVTCIEECANEIANQSCVPRCLEQTEQGFSYIKDNKALTVESNEDECLLMDSLALMKDGIKDGLPFQKVKKKTKNGGGKKTRKRKLLVPNHINIQNSTGIIKLRLMVDSSFMQIFVDFADGDVQAAKDEVEYFLALSINRVTLYYASLKRLNVTFNSSNGVEFSLDLAIALENITFPLQNSTDGSFYDIDPISRNREVKGENASLIMNNVYNQNNTLIGSTGFFTEFAVYMRELFDGPTSFDILFVLTGNDLVAVEYTLTDLGVPISVQRDDSVAGVAFTRSFCTDYELFGFDGRFGFVEFFVPYFDRVMAHELGHNLGAGHDLSVRCSPSSFTLMAPFSAPSFKNISAQFYNFSVCSAEAIAQHFSSFTSDRIATCLYTEKPSVEDFLDEYCKGLQGSRYDLKDHCKIFFGKDSYLCTNGSNDLDKGYVASDKCQAVLDSQFIAEPLLKCSNNNNCANTTNLIFHLFDGSKCLNADGAQGDQVCFNGNCTSDGLLCKRPNTGYGRDRGGGKGKGNKKTQQNKKKKKNARGKQNKRKNGKKSKKGKKKAKHSNKRKSNRRS